MLETVQALQQSGLSALGFRTVILDDCWQNTSRNSSGFLNADPQVFPRGMGWLASEVQRFNFTLGLYSTPGHFSCMKRPASEGYEHQDVKLWIEEWGARYFKYCVCNTTHARRQVAYKQMQDLLGDTKLPVVYEIDPSMEMPMTRMDGVGNVVGAHEDVGDSYEAWLGAITDLQAWAVYSGNHTRKGHWPLIDVVQIGRGGQSSEEYRSQVSMWVMLCSPLVLGIDFRNSTWVSAAMPFISNSEVLNIHQDKAGIHGFLTSGLNATQGGEVWVRPLSDGSFAVALWNARQPAAIDIGMDIRTLAPSTVSEHWQVRDVWANRDVDTTSGHWVERGVAPHSLKLLRFSALPLPLLV